MENKLKGLYVITDNRLISRKNFSEIIEKSLEGGAKIVQLREKGTPKDETIKVGKELLKLADKWNIPLIVNDLLEVTKQIGAHGVHLGESDPPIEEARKLLGESAIVGVSCYGLIRRGIEAESKGASYVTFGTPYPTPTKPGRRPTPFDVLREAKTRIRSIPVFAIGGITPKNARDVLETGVDGIAVITSVFGSPDPKKAAEDLVRILKEFGL
ncbi:MAG: thiamine phosphate synthase [Thermodesulfobacteriota bacterium]